VTSDTSDKQQSPRAHWLLLFRLVTRHLSLVTSSMAGYSKRTLQEKLGIKEGARIAFVGAPDGYSCTLGPLPKGVILATTKANSLDLIQCFTTRRADLERAMGGLKNRLQPSGALWVSWPKGSSGVATDLNENIVRQVALQNGLVDVKVCAVDNVWSGLKLVVRRKDRKTVDGG
jgi:hypothetical protein